jgi:hypothetical protein
VIFITAKQMFKGLTPEGKVLRCSKGGYDYGQDTFAYRICDNGERYNIVVLSDVQPRTYSVPYGDDVTVETLENAILYNEWKARVWAAREETKTKNAKEELSRE